MNPNIGVRTSFIEEEVCCLKEHLELPFMRRQRKLNRGKPPSLMEVLFTYAELVKTAPKIRVLSPEHKAKLLRPAKQHQLREIGRSQNRGTQPDAERSREQCG
jgi:hypothetical protein